VFSIKFFGLILEGEAVVYYLIRNKHFITFRKD